MIHLLLDIVFMETVGMRPVVVHGGGAAISRAMAEAGLEPRFVQGRRYTDDATLAIVERVLAGEINEGLAKQIQELRRPGPAAELPHHERARSASGLLLPGDNGAAGRPGPRGHGDCGRSGDHRATLPRGRRAGHSVDVHRRETGQKLNVNADTAATAVAQALQAEKLVYLSDVNGVRRDKNDPDSLIHSLTAARGPRLIASGAIDSGMIPKVAGLPGNARTRRPQDPHHRRPRAPLAAAGSVSPARAWARKSSEMESTRS